METPDDIGKADSEGGKGFRVSALPLGVDGGCGLRFHAGTGVADGAGDSFADADGDPDFHTRKVAVFQGVFHQGL